MSDVAKMAAALERPGIDPRKFVDLAVVTAVSVGAEGVHADVETITGLLETTALAPPYSGAGFGLYLPIDVDDFVVLAMPDGMFNAGGRIVGRTWDTGTPPPPEVIDHPEDVALVVKPGQTIRIIVSGGGDAVIEARDGGKVKLGSEDADEPPMTQTDGADLIKALDFAALGIISGNPFGAAALTALAQALRSLPPTTVLHSGQLWPVAASKVVVE